MAHHAVPKNCYFLSVRQELLRPTYVGQRAYLFIDLQTFIACPGAKLNGNPPVE
jgi:hypothetical protein